VIVTQGGRFGGWGFHLLKGIPVYTWNLLGLKRVRWTGTEPLSPGKHTLVFDFKSEGLGFGTLAFNNSSGRGRGATGVLKVDGRDETFDVGMDTGTPVDDQDYQVPFRFNGRLDKLTIQTDRPHLRSADEKRLSQQSQRNNRASQ
jgi:arylsulfatase